MNPLNFTKYSSTQTFEQSFLKNTPNGVTCNTIKIDGQKSVQTEISTRKKNNKNKLDTIFIKTQDDKNVQVTAKKEHGHKRKIEITGTTDKDQIKKLKKEAKKTLGTIEEITKKELKKADK